MRRVDPLAALLAFALALPAGARDGDRAGVTLVDRLGLGNPHRVRRAGTLAFAALDGGLAVLDAGSGKDLVLVGHVYLASAAYDVAIEGKTAYVAAGESGLVVVDVADPARPLVIGSVATPGARAVALKEGIAYVAETGEGPGARSGLSIIGVAAPAAPVALGFLELPSGASDVKLQGSIAWVGIGGDLADPISGLVAVDVADPARPQSKGFLPTPRAVNQLAIGDSVGYLACGRFGTGDLITADLANPALPRLLGAVAIADAARGIDLAGATAYVAAGAMGIVAYDVADARAPRVRGALRTEAPAEAVAVADGLALAATRSHHGASAVFLADVAAAAAPRRLGEALFAESTAVAASSSLLLLLERDGIDVLDAGNPAARPASLSRFAPAGADFSALAVAADRPLAAVADDGDVRLIDLTDPVRPGECGRLGLSEGTAVRMVFSGSNLYVVTGRGIEAFDVTSPGAARGLGSFATSGWSAGLAVDGGTGYLVAGDTLHVLDLSAPASLAALATLPIPGEQLFGVAVKGQVVALAGLRNFFYAVGVADPRNPALLGVLPEGNGFDVGFSGNRAIVARGPGGVSVVDLTDPRAPRLEGGYDTAGVASAIAIDGPIVHVAAADAAFWTLHCDTCGAGGGSGCVETWPVVAGNSLEATRLGGGQVLWSWETAGPGAEFNLHRTTAADALPTSWSDASTLVGAASGTSFVEALASPAGGTAFYQVFGRGSCSGKSQAP